MRTDQLMKMAVSFGSIAIIFTFLFAVMFYFIYIKVLKKGPIRKRYIVFGMLLCMYLVIVFGVTMFADGTRGLGDYRVKFHLFESYMQAWNTMSITEWRNLILNILLFIPMGAILPILFKKCRSWWITNGIGFLFTLSIELSQLFLKRGMCEADDLFNNTLGCIIGYGLYYICRYFYYHRQYSLKKAIIYQIPLFLTITTFLSLFIVYNQQELGNLKSRYNAKLDMSYIDLSCNIQLDDSSVEGYVYKKNHNYEDILNKLSSSYYQVDQHSYRLKVNDKDYLLYFDQDDSFVLTMDDDKEFNGLSNLKYKDIQEILTKYGLTIDKSVRIYNANNGRYELTYSFYRNGQYMYNGSMICTFNQDRELVSIESNVTRFSKYKKYSLLSVKEAYQMIEDGKISEYYGLLDSKIDLKYVTLSYEQDSKGYLQPVYIFQYRVYDEIKVIYIPAIRT